MCNSWPCRTSLHCEFKHLAPHNKHTHTHSVQSLIPRHLNKCVLHYGHSYTSMLGFVRGGSLHEKVKSCNWILAFCRLQPVLILVSKAGSSYLMQDLAHYLVWKVSFYSNVIHLYNYESFGCLHIIRITRYCHWMQKLPENCSVYVMSMLVCRTRDYSAFETHVSEYRSVSGFTFMSRFFCRRWFVNEQ